MNKARLRGIPILAAAGNEPGPIQLPGSQPGILPVGAGDTVAGGICPFSASTGLTFFAPGCTLDQMDGADNRGVLWQRNLPGERVRGWRARRAAQLRTDNDRDEGDTAACLDCPHTANLDATAAFRAAGLGSIVDAGNAAIPKPPPPLASVAPPTPAAALPARLARPRVQRATWRRGVLLITLRTLPKGARLHAKVTLRAS